MGDADRRKYPRLQGAPVLWRRAGDLQMERRQTVDVGPGGIRLYADAPHSPGERLELDLFLPDRGEIVCTVEVVWVETLPLGAPARFDVGFKFVDISSMDRARVAKLLNPE